jgi:hypothetical protein
MDEIRYLVETYGCFSFPVPWTAELARLEAGEPVIVSHGYQIDLDTQSGPYCLEADGTVTEVESVYADSDAKTLTVTGYRRPDGSMVSSARRAERRTGSRR